MSQRRERRKKEGKETGTTATGEGKRDRQAEIKGKNGSVLTGCQGKHETREMTTTLPSAFYI